MTFTWGTHMEGENFIHVCFPMRGATLYVVEEPNGSKKTKFLFYGQPISASRRSEPIHFVKGVLEHQFKQFVETLKKELNALG